MANNKLIGILKAITRVGFKLFKNTSKIKMAKIPP